MGIVFSRHNDSKQLISKNSLDAVEILITYLKRNVRVRGLFHLPGRRTQICRINKLLIRGKQHRLQQLLNTEGDTIVLECASALRMFLQNLKTPLIPDHIQAIALGDNNEVGAEMVAADVLGLIRQDVRGNQLLLLSQIFDLMHLATKFTNANELRGSNLPVQMLPIFFQLRVENVIVWRRIASIFEEMIRLAPSVISVHNTNNHQITISPSTRNQLVPRFIEQDPHMVASDPSLARGYQRQNSMGMFEVNLIYSQFIFYSDNVIPEHIRLINRSQLHPFVRRIRDRYRQTNCPPNPPGSAPHSVNYATTSTQVRDRVL